MAERLRDITDASQIADLSGYSPDLSLAQKVEVLETIDLEARLRLVLGWARETLADLTLREQIKTNVEEGMEKTQREFLLRRQLEAIRKELNELDGSADEGEIDDYRSKVGGTRPPRRREDGGAARGRQARAHQRAEPGTRVDPDLARHHSRVALGRAVRRQPRRRRGGGHPRRGPRRAQRRQGAHPGAPRGAQAADRSRARVHGTARLGRHPRARRTSGCGQDLARRVGGARPRTQVRARRARAACATRPRSGDTGVPTSAPSPGAWRVPCARRGP